MASTFYRCLNIFFVLCLTNIIAAHTDDFRCYKLGANPSFIIKFRSESHILQEEPLNKQLLQNLSQIAGVNFTNTTPMSGNATILHFNPNIPSLFTASKTTGCYSRKAIDRIINLLKTRADVKYVEPNLLFSIPIQHYHTLTTFRNSVVFNWNIRQIKADEAWDIGEEGNPNIIVAVIDSGIFNNLDLNPNILPTPAVAFINNGQAKYGIGANKPSCAFKKCSGASHGTMVAGVIANTMETNYGELVPGVGPKLSILAINNMTISDNPADCGESVPCISGVDSDEINAINWVAGKYMPSIAGFPKPPNGVHVINLSQSSKSLSCPIAEQQAINNAYKANILITTSASNDNTIANMQSPANCKHVISVAATASLGQRASYSNYNKGSLGYVLIAAPGGDTPNPEATPPIPGLRQATENGYETSAGGTSAAAPAVAGAAGLLYSYFPDLTPDEVTALLSDTASPFPSYQDYTYDCNNPNRSCGKGIVNVIGALKLLQSLLVKFTPPTATAMKLTNKLSSFQYCDPGYFVPTQQNIYQQTSVLKAHWSIVQDHNIGCETACEPKSIYETPVLINQQNGDGAIAKYGSICYELHSDEANCGLINAPGQTVVAGCFR